MSVGVVSLSRVRVGVPVQGDRSIRWGRRDRMGWDECLAVHPSVHPSILAGSASPRLTQFYPALTDIDDDTPQLANSAVASRRFVVLMFWKLKLRATVGEDIACGIGED